MKLFREKEIRALEAVQSLVEQGCAVHSLTVQQIADAAGVGKGTLYEYFESKEQILAGAALYQVGMLLEDMMRYAQQEDLNFFRQDRAVPVQPEPPHRRPPGNGTAPAGRGAGRPPVQHAGGVWPAPGGIHRPAERAAGTAGGAGKSRGRHRPGAQRGILRLLSERRAVALFGGAVHGEGGRPCPVADAARKCPQALCHADAAVRAAPPELTAGAEDFLHKWQNLDKDNGRKYPKRQACRLAY